MLQNDWQTRELCNHRVMAQVTTSSNLLPMRKCLGNCQHFENRKALVDVNRIDLKHIKWNTTKLKRTKRLFTNAILHRAFVSCVFNNSFKKRQYYTYYGDTVAETQNCTRQRERNELTVLEKNYLNQRQHQLMEQLNVVCIQPYIVF